MEVFFFELVEILFPLFRHCRRHRYHRRWSARHINARPLRLARLSIIHIGEISDMSILFAIYLSIKYRLDATRGNVETYMNAHKQTQYE